MNPLSIFVGETNWERFCDFILTVRDLRREGWKCCEINEMLREETGAEFRVGYISRRAPAKRILAGDLTEYWTKGTEL